MTPCIVITRDRVSYTRLCVAALERFPALEIHIVDHGSSWGPMLDYLDGSPHPVHRCGDHPPRALWDWEGLARIVGAGRYLVTDPDVLIDPGCPHDWLDRLNHELNHGDAAKVGLGLRLDDLPDNELAAKVRAWEAPFWVTRTPCRQAYRAPVDTTLALHPSLSQQPGFVLAPAARLDAPYLARHLPWYDTYDGDEAEHYRARIIPGSSHWANGGW